MLYYKLSTSVTYCCNVSIADFACYIFYLMTFLTFNCQKIVFNFQLLHLGRNSHPEVFYKNDVLKNLAKFTGKHLCQCLFFNKA